MKIKIINRILIAIHDNDYKKLELFLNKIY